MDQSTIRRSCDLPSAIFVGDRVDFHEIVSMNQVTIQTRIGPDGVLYLQIPFEKSDANQAVSVTVNLPLTVEETPEERWRILKSLEGSIPDLEIDRKSLGPLRDVEALN